ncbi:hypothetical protein AB0B79_30355 [Streptomyces sp. NPDC039022]|uniref:hypothetical protein n=1 Tax=Streptomyces sp. NPDC039022 TaxID=3157091 RepID=UPI0033C05D7E
MTAETREEIREKADNAREKAVEASAWAIRLVRRLGEGSGLLGRALADRLTSWCRKGVRHDLTGVAAHLGTAVRLAALGGVAYLGWRLVDARPWAMWLVAGGWTIAALSVTRPKKADGKATEGAGESSSEAPAADAIGPSPAEFVHLLHDLVEKCSEGGKRTLGLHHAQVVAELSSRYPERAWTPADSRALCEAAGVPLSRATRATGPGAARGASTGVRTEALPERPSLPSPGPSTVPGVAVVSAGQIEQQGQQQQQQQGLSNTVAFVQDETNPARWHVA